MRRLASPAGSTEQWGRRDLAAKDGAIPHLSARMIPDRSKLEELLGRAREAGLTHAFVVGGDADEPGDYLDGLSLLTAMREIGHPFEVLGCPGYPNGHADIPDAALEQALRGHHNNQHDRRNQRPHPCNTQPVTVLAQLRHVLDKAAPSGPVRLTGRAARSPPAISRPSLQKRRARWKNPVPSR